MCNIRAIHKQMRAKASTADQWPVSEKVLLEKAIQRVRSQVRRGMVMPDTEYEYRLHLDTMMRLICNKLSLTM
jgi:hypothetical protein